MIPEATYPLSFAQEQLWHHVQHASDRLAQNIVEMVHFEGAYDREAMTKAVNGLVSRHEILRTTFVNRNGQPVQIVHPEAHPVLMDLDLSLLPEQGREREWSRVIDEQTQKAFEVSRIPLLRATAIHLTREQHRLLLVLHPLLADMQSQEVIQSEMKQLYQAFSHGQPSSLPDLPWQYANFACWQREWLKGQAAQEQIAYWKQELVGTPTFLELVRDKPRPVNRSFSCGTEAFKLPLHLKEKLESLARDQQSTLAMVLEAALMALVHRYTEQDDILMGTAISGRTRPEVERLIGYFSNTVVLRAQFTGSENFCELLQQIRERLLRAYAQADLPFEQVVADLHPGQNPDEVELFQVLFGFVTPTGNPELPSLSRTLAGKSGCRLAIYIWETDDGLEGLMIYNRELFEAQTVRHFSGHYRTLLESVVSHPDQNLSALRILRDIEWRRLMTEWNNTEVTYPEKDLCLHELIEQQARRTPEQVAVVFEQERLSYAELNRRANKLAVHLRELKVAPETVVGLFADRSLEMIVAILGILKAGGAYVPIDTTFPQERIAFMLADAKVALVLTQTSLMSKLPGDAPQAICLDSFDWTIERELKHGHPGSHPENLAYVIYTSGSTGRPKGVCIEHRNIVNYVLGVVEQYHLKRGMNHAMVSTIAADLCNTAIFPALVTGGCLHVISQERAQSHALLSDYFEREKIDVLKIVPSHLAALQSAGAPHRVMPGSCLILGGEALWLDWVAQLRGMAPHCEIYNEYGPTETTVGVLVYHVGAQLPTTPSGTLPSGRPLPNSRIYILDSHMQPVPVGVQGEICIGGTGVGRGYLNRPELTAEKFVADPFCYIISNRLYHSGDRGRYLPDGNVEFWGRVDRQVKIHGYRVELGEIERTIRQQHNVQDVIVTTNEDESDGKELVAYVVPKRANQPLRATGSHLTMQKPADGHVQGALSAEEQPLTPTTLRKSLSEQLPHYMIPSAVVVMEKLPLMANGKVDYKSLPSPRPSIEAAGDYAEPRDPLEKTLADIWAKVLKMERVGIHDDFFDLGGHSLLAVRTIAEFAKVSDKRLPLAMLLKAPTIAGLADLLRNESHEASWSSLVAIEGGGSKPPLFLVHGAEGNVMLYKQLARYLGSDQRLYGLQSQGLKGDGLVHTTVEEMATHYIKEVKRVQPHGPFYLGGYCLGGAIALEMAQQLKAQGRRVALVAMIDTYNLSLIPLSKLRRLTYLHVLQNAWFHSANFLSTKKGDRWRFLRQKWEVANFRLGIRVRTFWDDLQGWTKAHMPNSYPHVKVKKINDRAMAQYIPKPYTGHVVLIRPKGHFWGQADPALGWGEVIRGQLDVRVNPAYPKGVMVDPYVQALAHDLKECLQVVQMAEASKKFTEVTVHGEQGTTGSPGMLDSKQMAQVMAGILPTPRRNT